MSRCARSWPARCGSRRRCDAASFDLQLDRGVQVFFSIAFFALLIAVASYCIVPLFGFCFATLGTGAGGFGCFLLFCQFVTTGMSAYKAHTNAAGASPGKPEIQDGGEGGDINEEPVP